MDGQQNSGGHIVYPVRFRTTEPNVKWGTSQDVESTRTVQNNTQTHMGGVYIKKKKRKKKFWTSPFLLVLSYYLSVRFYSNSQFTCYLWVEHDVMKTRTMRSSGALLRQQFRFFLKKKGIKLWVWWTSSASGHLITTDAWGCSRGLPVRAEKASCVTASSSSSRRRSWRPTLCVYAGEKREAPRQRNSSYIHMVVILTVCVCVSGMRSTHQCHCWVKKQSTS